MFIPVWSIAQGLINNGANIVLTNTSTLNITGNYTNQGNGLIHNKTPGGIINLSGNWVNNGSNTAFFNDGTLVVFKSSNPQTIAGTQSTGFYNIKVSGGNTGTKMFNTASTVSRLVTVDNNTVLNANNKLTLLASATSHGSIGSLLNGASVSNNVIVQYHN